MAVISVDAGTTMIKAVGYDNEGRELVVVRQETTVNRLRPGWAEQDMVAVWDAVVYTVRSVAHQLTETVEFVAITAQGDGAWLVDGAGAPTGPAILWSDGRAAPLIQAWTADGTLNRAFEVNGSLAASGLPNAILSWLAANDQARLDRSTACLTCGGWLYYQMTGVVGIDESEASAPFLDIRSRRYSTELLDLYGVPWARRLLPQILPDDQRAAALTRDAAIELGVPAGTPVVLAPYDIAATAIGVGAVAAGQACSILGTTLCTEVVTDGVLLGNEPSGITIALGGPEQYLRAFPTFAGGEVTQWACQLLGLSHPSELSTLATESTPGANGLVFQPYLSPAGERAPFLNPAARGGFLGLSLEHRREDIARAVLEGLTLVIQDCLVASRAQPTELRVCGGGAASAAWLQLIADVTGATVIRSVDSEVGAKGAFLTGLVAVGAADSIPAAAPNFVRLGDTYQPSPANTPIYAGLFADYLTIREATAQAWPTLANTRQRLRAATDSATDSARAGGRP